MRNGLRIVAWVAGGAAAVVLLAFLVGLFLPARHSVDRTIT